MPMMTTTPTTPLSKRLDQTVGQRRGWFAEGARFRHRSLSPLTRKTTAKSNATLEPSSSSVAVVEYVPPPVEVTLEEAKKILKLARSASPTPTTTSTISAPETPNDTTTTTTPAAVVEQQQAVVINTTEDASTGWFSRRRLLRKSLLSSKLPQPSSSQPLPSSQTAPSSQQPQPIHSASTMASEPALMLTNPTSIPEFLNIREIVSELPPPNLMDDASSVQSASSSTITCSVDHASPAGRFYYDDGHDDLDDEELGWIASTQAHNNDNTYTKYNNAEPVSLDDPVLQKGWWERLWEMVDPDEATVISHVSDMESVTDEKDVEPLEEDEEPLSSSTNKATTWWRKSRRADDSTAPIRPPSRGVMDEEDMALIHFETIQEVAVATAAPAVAAAPAVVVERPPIVFTDADDDDDDEIEREVTQPASCLFCYLFPTSASTIAAPDSSSEEVEQRPAEALTISKDAAQDVVLAKEAAVDKPVAKETIIDKLAEKETIIEMPVAKESAIEKPVAKEAIVEKPAPKAAVVESPAAARESNVVKPVVAKEPVQKPIVCQPAHKSVANRTSLEKSVANRTTLEKPLTKESVPKSTASPPVQKSIAMVPIEKESLAAQVPSEKQPAAKEATPEKAEPTQDGAAAEKEQVDEEKEEADAISIILSKLDRKIFPWICRTEEEPPAAAAETNKDKASSSSDASLRKVRFAADVKEEDDDEIIEKVQDVADADKLKENVEPSALTKFLDWLVAVEKSAVSLTGTNDALCQPLNKLAESENPGSVFSCVMDPKIPTEINFLTCNYDDSTVLTTDPASALTTTAQQKKSMAITKFLFRRNGKALPVLTPPFLRKAPVNKEREKQEIELARAMWRHYKKTKDMKENITDIKRLAERQRQREEWAAAVAAHRRLRQCNHVNCQCRQEQW